MNPFRRTARTQAPALPPDQARIAWQAISLLLDYPSTEWAQSHDAIRRAVAGLPEGVRMPLGSFLDHVASQPLEQVQREYVVTFDHARRCCLFLTYFTFGDTRRRGVALVQFKQAYRRAGLEFTGDELPDHLCVVLEFGATADHAAAEKLLTDYRAGVEMLRLALQERSSPWAHLIVALCATLPELDGEGLAAVQRLIEEGPPQEDVGLEGYALDPRLNPRPELDVPLDTKTDLGRTIPVGAPS
ncbi:MAG TPA: nitrate reductase molybdenum cofactor assembly chaperone [Intrasporangium sp.]|nr:nitrate reductase molybdenum cofactor assembly chaperone [Intrasporangium sp.]